MNKLPWEEYRREREKQRDVAISEKNWEAVAEYDRRMGGQHSKKGWESQLEHTQPKNYQKIHNIVEFLKRQQREISRASILEEMDNPTVDDNQAIEYILNMQKMVGRWQSFLQRV